MWYTYVLYSLQDRKFYTGFTSDISRRLDEHSRNKTQTTARMNEPVLVYLEGCLSKADATARERQLKTGFGRAYINRRLKNYFMGQ